MADSDQRYDAMFQDLEILLQSAEEERIKFDKLREGVAQLKVHLARAQKVEENIEEIRSEVIAPIRKELAQNKTAGKFSMLGFYVGGFGLLASIFGLVLNSYINVGKANQLAAIKNLNIQLESLQEEASLKDSRIRDLESKLPLDHSIFQQGISVRSLALRQLATREIPFTKDEFLEGLRRGQNDKTGLFLAACMEPTNNGIPGLLLAAAHGDQATVSLLIGHGVDVDTRNRVGETALMVASIAGKREVVKALLENGAGIDKTNLTTGSTALMYAAEKGNIGVVELLLEKGANKFIKNRRRETAASYAEDNGHINIVKLLRQ